MNKENALEKRNGRNPRNRRRGPHRPKKVDPKVQESIKCAEEKLVDSLTPITLEELNKDQRRELYRYFDRSNEFRVKTYTEGEKSVLRIYPVGNLKRLAEQKIQEVLMHGKPESLPVMGSFERFVIHDYLKEREGVRTASVGEKGKDRHIEIHPVFGRTPKKVKKKIRLR
jgi:predicted RNA-binding protein Jag